MFLDTMEIQTKTTYRSHLTLPSPSSKNIGQQNMDAYEDPRKSEHIHRWECNLVQTLWKSIQRPLRTVELPHDPALPLIMQLQ